MATLGSDSTTYIHLKWAMAYYRLGWSVIPLHTIKDGVCTCRQGRDCSSPGKHPRINWTPYQSQMPTELEIRQWWRKWPDANIGIVTGAISGIIVLDVDGPEGLETLKKGNYHIPTTALSATGGGGWHYIYKHPGGDCRNFAGKTGETILPKVDFRGDGGMIVAAPSVHISGRRYEWSLSPKALPPGDPPAWLVELIRKQASSYSNVTPLRKVSPEDWTTDVLPGQRNETLTRLAGSLLTRMSAADALPMLLAWNAQHCTPPLPETEVQQIVESIAKKESQKPKDTHTHIEIGGYGLTDLGNAKRLVARHGEDLRYCYPWQKWLIWDGTRWAADNTGEIVRRAKDTALSIAEEAQMFIGDGDAIKKIQSWANRSESDAKIRAMISLAQSEESVPILPEELDRDPWLLNVKNGTLDLRTGELREHRREDLCTKIAPVAYDPNAKCPLWEAFLDRILDGNEAVIGFLKRAIGYTLTGLTTEQVLFFLFGTGANGKSTFIEVLRNLLGDYAQQADFSTFLAKDNNDAAKNDIARMVGARFIAASEAGDGRKLSEVTVKQLTGGDTITARFLFKEFFEFKPVFKLFLAANHKPVVKGTDYALWRRIRLIPFTVTIPPEERDPKLTEKLKSELSGILRWAVEGCLEWQKVGLQAPDEVIAATEGYRAEMDILSDFLEEYCVQGPSFWVTARELYRAYQEWCEESGLKAMSQHALGRRLAERGFDRGRGGSTGAVRWLGIGLKSERGQVEMSGVSVERESAAAMEEDDYEPY